MSDNAYSNILPARYLERDEDNEVVESQAALFERVARNIALAEAAYVDERIMLRPEHIKQKHSQPETLVTEVFGEGVEQGDDEPVELTEQNVNKFDYEAVLAELSSSAREQVTTRYERFEEMMTSLDFLPNSPTLMNAGLELQQLSACFVNSPADDIDDIHRTVRESASVFQSGGGNGYAFWNLRPYGDAVGSTGGIASGPISFMHTFDTMCETIAQGGKRRGAQMSVLRVDHPDIIEFIHAKNKDVSLAHSLRLNDPDDYTHTTFLEALEEARELIDEDGKVPAHLRNAVEGHLSNFNISVGVTNDFMDAVYANEEFELVNPRTEEQHIATPETRELYERYGLGEYVTPGEPLAIPAQILWDRMIDGAHENGEPGVIYLERVNEEHSFDVEAAGNEEYEILATNPCGEQALMEYEACNLGHINLSTIVDDSGSIRDYRVFKEAHGEAYDSEEALVEAFLEEAIDFEEFDYRIETGTRFLENVVTMSDFPIEEIEQTVAENRKIGLGIMGLAQMYIQLGVAYGSEEGNEIARQVMMHINRRSKAVSHEIAQARGTFDNWGDSKYATPERYADWFEHHTGEDATDWADGYPIRNHNTTTIAPTGTTGMIGNTSGGCEPIFSVAYYKNVSDDVQGEEMLVEFDDYFLRTLEANDIDVTAVKTEAATQMQNNEFDGVAGLETVPAAIGELFVVTSDLSGIDHAGVQCACQQGVDSAISKTCNFPNSASKTDMEEVYRYIYDNGGKGVTVYRDGTRSKQVLTTRADNTEFSDTEEALAAIESFATENDENREKAMELLRELAADDDGSFEAATEVKAMAESEYTSKRDRPDSLRGVTQRIPTGYGNLYVNINEDATGRPFELFANIGSSGGFTNSFTEALAKSVSVALRSGVDPREIGEELQGTRSPKVAWDSGTQISSIPDAIGIALMRYLDGDIETPTQSEPTTDGGTTQTDENTTETTDATQELIDAGESPECPECGGMNLAYQEGCMTCQNPSCGWSKCS
jgi:ribonucleoside-diphosphate reductase alpha chain